MHGLKLSDQREDDVWWITAQGYLDASTAEELESLVDSIFGYGVYKVVFDLSGVSFISSAGAGVLMAAYKTCETHGGEAVFAGPTDSVAAVFTTLGLNSVFTIVSSRGAARRHFS